MSAERGNARLRAVDYYLGVPLVTALAAVRRRRPRPAGSPRRVGFLRTGGIGDTVLLSGVLQDAAAVPGVAVYLFTGTANAAAGRLVPGVADVVSLPVTDPVEAVRRVRSVPLDVMIDTGAWPRIDALLAFASRAAWTAGFRTAGQHRHRAYDVAVPHSADVHEIDNFRRLATAAGFPSHSAPRLVDGDAPPPGVVPSRPFVVCHLWSGGYKGYHKEWPLDRWRALVTHVVRRGFDVVFTGGPEVATPTRAFAESTDVPSSRVHALAGVLSLAETLHVLRRSAGVVSVNTGIMHMAAAAGVPVVSLEGPVPVHRWGPIGPAARSVVSDHPGAGFLNLGWEYDGAPADTMLGVDTDAVIAAVDALVGA